MRRLLAILGLIPTLALAESYEICLISDSPEPVCFTLITDLPKDEIIAVTNYPNGDIEINIAGVDMDLRCRDNGTECLLAVKPAESPYFANGAVLNAVCAGTTLLETVADGFNGTFTRPTYSSEQCGYVDDPCFSGSWYIGWGNPECEDPNGDIKYRKVCPSGSSGEYVLMTPGSCL